MESDCQNHTHTHKNPFFIRTSPQKDNNKCTIEQNFTQRDGAMPGCRAKKKNKTALKHDNSSFSLEKKDKRNC